MKSASTRIASSNAGSVFSGWWRCSPRCEIATTWRSCAGSDVRKKMKIDRSFITINHKPGIMDSRRQFHEKNSNSGMAWRITGRRGHAHLAERCAFGDRVFLQDSIRGWDRHESRRVARGRARRMLHYGVVDDPGAGWIESR